MASRDESSSPTKSDGAEDFPTQQSQSKVGTTSNSSGSASVNLRCVLPPKRERMQLTRSFRNLKRSRSQCSKPMTPKGGASDEPSNEDALGKRTRQNISNCLGQNGGNEEDLKQSSKDEITVKCNSEITLEYKAIEDDTTKEMLEDISDHDVLCGRQKMCYHHEGNRSFRHLINLSLEPLRKATTREQKSDIAHSIVECISARGGRFLKRDPRTNNWCVLLENMIREKVNHALRDGLAHQWKSQQSSVKETLRLIDKVQDHDPILSDEFVVTRMLNERHDVTVALKRKRSSDSNISDSILDDYNEIPLSSVLFYSDSPGNSAIRGNDTTSEKECHIDMGIGKSQSIYHDNHKRK